MQASCIPQASHRSTWQTPSGVILDRTVLISLHEAAQRRADGFAQRYRWRLWPAGQADGALAQLGERLNRIQ